MEVRGQFHSPAALPEGKDADTQLNSASTKTFSGMSLISENSLIWWVEANRLKKLRKIS